jgi:hypothetical protein
VAASSAAVDAAAVTSVAADTVATVATVAPEVTADAVAATAGTLADTGAATAATADALNAAAPTIEGSLLPSMTDTAGSTVADSGTAANIGAQDFGSVLNPDGSIPAPDATTTGVPNPVQVTGAPSGTSTQFVPGVDNSIYTGDTPTDVPNPLPNSGAAVPPDSGASPLDWFNGLSPESRALTLQALGGAFKGVWDAKALTALQQLKNQQTIEQQQRGDASVAGLNIQPANISSGGLIANSLNGAGYTSPAAAAATIGAGSNVGGLPALPGLLGQNPNLNPANRTG